METTDGILRKLRAERDPRQAVLVLMQSLATIVRDEVTNKITEIIDANHELYADAVMANPDDPAEPDRPSRSTPPRPAETRQEDRHVQTPPPTRTPERRGPTDTDRTA